MKRPALLGAEAGFTACASAHGRHGTASGGSGSGAHCTLARSRVGRDNSFDTDLALKEKVLAKTNPIKSKRRFYRPDDELLGFLKTP